MMQKTLSSKIRFVSEHGETLVVRDCFGKKVLTDPCDQDVVVFVPSGRRAKLICFSFSGQVGRDASVIVTYDSEHGVSFCSVGCPFTKKTSLQDLVPGQVVDILPATEPAVAYAILRKPLPALSGAVAVQPTYSQVAA